MLSEGLEVMVIGITVVFCFLVLLVCVMKMSSAIILKFFPEEKISTDLPQTSGNERTKIAAAIAIAISRKHNIQ